MELTKKQDKTTRCQIKAINGARLRNETNVQKCQSENLKQLLIKMLKTLE